MKFLEAIKIINEIQNQFEKSIQENKPAEEIKRIIGVRTLDLNNYVPLSQEQQDCITKDIMKASELRIQNYQTVFNYIKISLDEIQSFLETNVNIDDDVSNFEEIKRELNERNIFITKESEDSAVETDVSQKLFKKAASDEKIKEKEIIKLKKVHSETTRNDDADFSERIMMENALVLPPKNSPFNYQNVKDMTRMRSKKFSVYGEDMPKRVKTDEKKVSIANILEEGVYDSDKEQIETETNKETAAKMSEEQEEDDDEVINNEEYSDDNEEKKAQITDNINNTKIDTKNNENYQNKLNQQQECTVF